MIRTFVFAALSASAVMASSYACSTSSGPDTATLVDGGTSAIDSGANAVPTSEACVGDAAKCLAGTVTASAFGAYSAAKVELFRVFPIGGAVPAASMALAKSGKYAFSNLDGWGHYYVKATLVFGNGTSAAAVGALRGRLAVPPPAAQSADVTVAPLQLELLETNVGGARSLQYASAHVFDPTRGTELTDATVTFSSSVIAAQSMPYTTNLSGAKSYFIAFTTPAPNQTAFHIDAAHALLGTAPTRWDLTPEPALFGAPTLLAPAEGATISPTQPLDVTWNAEPASDYTLVELFRKGASGYAASYVSPLSLSPTDAKVTIPASSLGTSGTYLVNVDSAQAGCQVAPSAGCTYLLEPATARVTAQ
jgi:hypothetical protein